LLHRHLGSVVFAVAIVTTALAAQSASADETVTIGGSRAVPIKPKAVRASVIFMPGDNGAIEAGDHGDIHGLRLNVMIRNRQAYVARGIAVLIADWNTDLKSAVDYMAAIKRPVTVIATSRGTIRAAQGNRARCAARRAGPRLGASQPRIRKQQQCDVDPGIAERAAAHARHPSPGGWLQGDAAGRRRPLH
jgi:hypothetical protein